MADDGSRRHVKILFGPIHRGVYFFKPSPAHIDALPTATETADTVSIMNRLTAQHFEQDLLDAYDYYVHGQIDRRTFLERAAKYAVGGVTALALLEMLSPKYALAAQVPKEDSRVTSEYQKYPSSEGHGEMRGLFAKPSGATTKLPGVLVVHENRGLNPYIEDVTRRVAAAGFVAFAPDALYPLGGYPGTDDEGRTMQQKIDKGKMTEDFVAAVRYLQAHPDCNGSIGVTGFCFGGAMANTLAWRLPNVVKTAVPYYGGQPSAEEAAKIKGALLIHFAELDTRVNAGWPAYEAALKSAGVEYQAYIYPGVNHGFHNDTTPRFDEAAATLSWTRTIDFFRKKIG